MELYKKSKYPKSVDGPGSDKEQEQYEGLNCYPIEHTDIVLEEFDKEASETEIRYGINKVLSSAEAQEDLLLQNADILILNAEYELALTLLKEAIHLNPQQDVTIKKMGQCFMGLGRVEKAIECFKSATVRSKTPSNLALLAKAYYSSGSDEQALEFYLLSLESKGLIPSVEFEVYKNIGNIYVRAGELDLAEQNYNRAYTLNPKSDILLVNYGTLEMQKQNFDLALENFRKAIGLNKNNDKAWVGLALIHREYGDHVLSWANLERALDLNSKNPIALQIYIDWGMKDSCEHRVIAWLENYLIKNPKDSNVSSVLAQLLFRMERFKHCEFELKRTLSLDPSNIEALKLKPLAHASRIKKLNGDFR